MNNGVNLLKLAVLNNKKGFVIKKNNLNTNIIKSFIKIGLIKFIKIENKKIIVYINYINNKILFKNIINLWKKNNIKTISYKKLIKINKKYNWIHLISTNKGVLNTYEAIEQKIGGILISQIWN